MVAIRINQGQIAPYRMYFTSEFIDLCQVFQQRLVAADVALRMYKGSPAFQEAWHIGYLHNLVFSCGLAFAPKAAAT